MQEQDFYSRFMTAIPFNAVTAHTKECWIDISKEYQTDGLS